MFKKVMNNTLLGKISIFALVYFCASAIFVFGQSPGEKVEKVNFRYSQNPKTKTRPAGNEQNKAENPAEVIAAPNAKTENTSIAKQTLEIAKQANAESLSPTEVYKVGVGDILFINLQNSPKDSTYYTILNDGSIDYPLAGQMVTVAGLTTDEIEETLKGKIKLYENGNSGENSHYSRKYY